MKSFSTQYLRFSTETVFSSFFLENSSVLQRLIFGFTKVHGVKHEIMAVLKINENERGHFLWILSTDLTDSHLKKSFFH